MNFDLSPPIYRCNEELPVLDRNLFKKDIRVLCARIQAVKVGSIIHATETKAYVVLFATLYLLTFCLERYCLFREFDLCYRERMGWNQGEKN